MESLDKAICLRMIRSCHEAFDAPCLGQLEENGGRKLGASVCGNGGWATEMLHPSVCEGVDDALRGDVHHGNGHGPSRKAVNSSQEVFITI